MATVLPSLALLACPIGMGLMMWFMAKGNRKERPEASVEELRAEHRRLSADIEAAERQTRP